MKPLEHNVFFCKLCYQKFKQFKNGKLMYLPLGLAQSMDVNKILFTFDSEKIAETVNEIDRIDERLKKIFKDKEESEPQTDDEFEFDIDFEPDFDPDETT